MGGGDLDGVAFESFYQQEALHQRIKNILAEYPAGLGPLKEFLQNADDAGASEFALVLDERQHGTDASRMVTPGIRAQHGRPALLVCNNAVFSDADFKSITSLGQSGKFTDSSKIGKYGLGFNVSYHYSDVVEFVSRDQLVIFDPQQASLPDNLPGIRLNFVHAALSARAPHQVMPFTAAAGSEHLRPYLGSMDESLDCTVFRLALRTEEEAKASLLCAESHTAHGMLQLFGSFAAEAAAMMVFLRHVRRVKMLRIDEGGEATLLATVDQSTQSAPTPQRVGPTPLGTCLATPSILEQTTVVHGCTGPCGRREEQWLVVGATGDEEAYGLPYGAASALGSRLEGAVALPIRDVVERLNSGADEAWAESVLGIWGQNIQGSPGSGGASAAVEESSDMAPRSVAVRSHAYCYLPLPINTGLPVHVHATFALSSNRRSLWIDDDASKADAKVSSSDNSSLKASWNQALLKYLVGPVVAHAVHSAAATGLIDPSTVALYWPAADASVKTPFDIAARAFASEVARADLGVLWAQSGPGGRDGALARLSEVSFVPLHDHGVTQAMIGPLRVIGAANVVSPAAVTALLDAAGVEYNVLCNASVRAALLNYWAGTGHGVIPFDTVNGILRFMLRHWDPTSGQDGDNAAILRSLAGLPLIPLANGTAPMGVLGRIGPNVPVHYIVPAQYQSLFLGCGRLVDTKDGDWALASLVGETRALLNIKRLTPGVLAKSGPGLVLPQDWASHDAVPARAGHISGGTAQDEELIKDYRKQSSAMSKASKKPNGGSKNKSKKNKARVRVEAGDHDWMDEYPIEGDAWEANGDEDTAQPIVEPPPLRVPFRLEPADVTSHLQRLWMWLAEAGATSRDIQQLAAARWPLIPTDIGIAVSVPYSKLRGVLPRQAFDDDTAAVLAKFGCLFSDLPADERCRSLWADEAVGITERKLLHALYDGVTAGRYAGPREPSLCQNLRNVILNIAKDKYKRSACLADPASVRVLPIFKTVGPAVKYLPADRAVSASPAPEWDDHLAKSFPGEILDIEGDDAEVLMSLAAINPARGGRPDVASFLDIFLLPRVANGAGDVMPQELCLLVLKFIGTVKWWTRSDVRLLEALQAASIVCDDEGENPRRRRRCDQTFNPEDPMMLELGRAMNLESILGVEGPPVAYQRDADVMKAMSHLGMPGLAAPEVFLRVAAEVEKRGRISEARVLMTMLARIHDSSSPVRALSGWSEDDFAALGKMKVFVCYRANDLAVLPKLLGDAMSQKDLDLYLAASSVKTDALSANRGRQGRKKMERVRAELEGDDNDTDAKDGKIMGLRPGNVRKALELASSILRSGRPGCDQGRSDGDILGDVPQGLIAPQQGDGTEGPVMPGADALAAWTVLPVMTPLLSRVNPAALRMMGVLTLAERAVRFGQRAPHTTVIHLQNLCRPRSDAAPASLNRGFVIHTLAATAATVWATRGSRAMMDGIAQTRCIITDDGDKWGPADVVLDADDGFGGRRALPVHYEALEPMLAALGALNIASRGQPTVDVTPLPDLTESIAPFLRSHYNKAEYADVAFVDPACPEQRVFAHRVVLAFTSPALATVLAARPGGALNTATLPEYPGISVVEVPAHIGISAVELLVDVIYNGSTALAWLDSQVATPEAVERVCGLLMACDMFLVTAVREWCEAWIAGKEVIQTHNVLALYGLAQQTSARQLKRVCQYHIQRLAPALMVTEEWAALSPEEQAEAMGVRRK